MNVLMSIAARIGNRLSKSLPRFALAATGLVVGASLLTGGEAKASLPLDPGLKSFNINCNCSNTSYQGTVGWDFTVNENHDINLLGVYDAGGDGLAVATDVGLWNRGTNTLLASVTVPQGTAGHLLGQFRYAQIPALALQPGVNYALGALYKQPYQSDWYQLITNNNVFAPWISYGNPTETPIGGVSLALPSNVGQSPYGIYGPNLASTPGPLPLLGAGAAFSFTRKLRRRVKTFRMA
jgi:hypothetical protein